MQELIKIPGPLHYAIECLLESIDTIEVNRAELSLGVKADALIQSYRTAVRILKAASRIYKTTAIQFINRMNEDDDARDKDGLMTCPQITISNLLSSLPDEEED